MSSRDDQVWRGRIWTGSHHGRALYEDGVLHVSQGRISSLRDAGPADPEAELDRYGRLHTILPGMVDLHNHGGAGHSFPTSGEQGCRTAAAHHRSRGSTTLLASLVSAAGADLIAQASVLAQLANEGVIAGIHCEGPFLNEARCGAQDPAALIPGDPQLLRQIIEAAGGHLRSITVAPEIEGFSEVLQVCADHGIVVSFGHSDATAAQTRDALDAAQAAGARVSATHLFNGMPGLHHRSPGIAGAMLQAASESSAVVELIADGVHLDDATVAIALAAAEDHVVFVSDAMAAAGIGDGSYTLGGASVSVRSGIARLLSPDTEQGSIAGGTSSLVDQLLRHAGSALLTAAAQDEDGITGAARIVRACTSTPADLIGLHDRGTLAPQRRADLVTLDSRGEVAAVVVQGHQQQCVPRPEGCSPVEHTP